MKKPARAVSSKYVPGSVAQSLLEKLVHIGGNPAAILRKARVPYSPEEFSSGVVTRLSRSDFVSLSRECVVEFEAYASRNEGHPPWDPRVTNMLCYCVINCIDLHETIVRAAEFCRLAAQGVASLSLREEGEHAMFIMKTARPQNTAALVCDLLGLSLFHRLFGWLIGEEIKVTEVNMSFDESLRSELISGYFNIPITLGRKENSLTFPARELARPVVRTYPELQRFLEYFPYDTNPIDSSEQPLAETLKLVYRGALVRGSSLPTTVKVAKSLGLSPATLRRRLAAEGSSLHEVKESCRHELASELLQHSQLSTDEIAARVGFSGYKTFSHAFRQWTGSTAAEFRARFHAD